MISGAGLQNIVLEVLFIGKPVVTTAFGNEGVGATVDNGLYVCKTKSDYINVIIRLLENEDCASDILKVRNG